MKERIVFERDIEYLKELEREREEMFMTFPEYRTEQVPETFEELKKLCKDLEGKNVFITCGGECIEFNGLYFWKDGSITTTQNNNDIWATKTNLTPARQWQIIKSLIGEE